MSDDSAFKELMDRLRAGDQDAAAEVFRRFANRLIGLARTHLDHRLRQKVDPEDVMQSALHSFFHRHRDGQFDLANWNSLWAMLVVITLRKCGHQAEHFRAACRAVERERSGSVSSGDDSASSWQAIASDPTPSQAALLAEAVEQIMQSMGDERERLILKLALQGHTPREISDLTEIKRTERTVQRVLERVRRRLERMRDGDGEA
ncbi:MAG: ECF-type sigma factor [Gemmataceae bacterium]|nr:ECF-type sigma factor [Gemmataceae bacterium]